MSSHLATIRWTREGDFGNDHYSRAHRWEFDGGAVVAASASPDIVQPPQSVAENVDPEEAFVASLSSCHMLFFLSIAAKRGFIVESYVDEASGTMATDEHGRMCVTKVRLQPKATYSGDPQPTREQIDKMHHRSHGLCFIANSVRTEIEVRVLS